MDNHAGKTERVCWLAGLIDGDGSIGIHKQPHNGNGHLVPAVSICTSCLRTYAHLNAVFDEIGIGRHWTQRNNKSGAWATVWVLQVRGMKRCKPLLEMLRPYLVTKQQEADLLLEFIRQRLDSPYRKGYTPEQIDIVKRLQALKHTRHIPLPVSSETRRQTPADAG